jgi:isocitrate dehydrogenase
MADSSDPPTIRYTITDEAPQLATYALLPVIKRFAGPCGVKVESPDISLASRIISQFPERLTEEQREPDALAMLGELTQSKGANIVKLPNVSSPVTQLLIAIAELQKKGYNLPDYPSNPQTDEEKAILAKYQKVTGSAVNPVLREGNSDRRVAAPVKKYAQKNRLPVRMRDWSPESKTHVASMSKGDFYGSEKSCVFKGEGSVRIVLKKADGEVVVLKDGLNLQDKEVIDAACLSAKELRAFFEEKLTECKEKGLMASLHLKATMMKVSDPVLFGHCVSVYFKDVFEKHAKVFEDLGVNPNHGVAALYNKLDTLEDKNLCAEIKKEIEATYGESRPGLAMVDSSKGITNLHVPSDVIIDASMPPLVRDGGKMWNRHDALEDTMAMIPDRSYAGMYQGIIDDCKKNGQFDHSKTGSVSNVGLMAQKAEEYGSHNKTFILPASGKVQVIRDGNDEVIFEHDVEAGDLWRMCQTKDAPIRDWVKLAVSRAKASGSPVVFWLDENRAHDSVLRGLVAEYLKEHPTEGLQISVQNPIEAMAFSCARARKGEDTISATGNVLRDYLTDLFPILELGTSAKMLSIVPLLAGGGLFETGAGGSAPKHVQQFTKENHLRWDSLGEYLALACSLAHLAEVCGCEKSKQLGEALNEAVGLVLDNNKSPSRKVNEIDNRGTTFYIAMYWARAMAKRGFAQFNELASKLEEKEAEILKDLIDCQGVAVDVGGYFKLDDKLAAAAMRPSATFNDLIDNF